MGFLKSVRIEEGCLVCGACEVIAPAVFRTDPKGAVVLGDVREDGITSTNAGLSPLNEDARRLDAAIREAADSCCVEAISLIEE